MLGRGLVVLMLPLCLWGASDCSHTSFSNTNITCVQSSNQILNNQTVTLDNSQITFGDSVVVLCRGSSAVTAFSITDATNNINANNTWTALTPLTAWATAGSPTLHEQLFWIQAANSIPNSSPPGNQNYRITCNPTGGIGSVSAVAWQLHSPTGIINIDAQSTFSAADSVSGSRSISISPTKANDLLFAIVDHTGTITSGSGFTATDTGPVSEAMGLATSGSTAATYSLSSSQSTVGLAIAFEEGNYPSTPFISRPQATDCLNTFPCTIAPTGAGHFLVAAIVAGVSSPPAFFVSGGCATSWVPDSDNSSVTIGIFHCSDAIGGATSISMGPTADIFAASVIEYSVTPGYTIQRDPGANAVATTIFSGSTNNPQTAQATTTGADDVVVGVVSAMNDLSSVMPTPNGWTNPILCGCGGAAVTDALNVTPGFNNKATLVITGGQGAGSYSSASVAYEAVPNNVGALPSPPTSLSAGSVGGGIQPCDANNDGSVNVQDVQLAIDMDLGSLACTLNINGTCNVVTIQRVINAALGLSCVTGPGVTANSVSLSWTASTSSGVAGYNVYRGATAAGPFAKVNSTVVAGTTYTDITVQPGQTYYYVLTAVDGSNNQSPFSAPAAQSVVPSS